MHGNKYLQTTLVESAWGATRKKDGFFKKKYHSLSFRRGKKKALVAIGHKIIIAVYHILNNQEVYKEPVFDEKSRKNRKQIRNSINRLNEFGFNIEEVHNQFKSRFFTETV